MKDKNPNKCNHPRCKRKVEIHINTTEEHTHLCDFHWKQRCHKEEEEWNKKHPTGNQTNAQNVTK